MNKLVSLLRKNNGMSMIEMTVAIALGAVILTAGAGTLASAMGGVNFSRQNQQSAALVSEIIEETRGAGYASVAVKRDASALAADGRLTSLGGGSYSVDPDGAGPLGAETLIISDTGSVPLLRILERNSTRYSVSTYVTAPTGADADFRRVTTVVTWTKGNKTSERRSASFVTNTRRGLPLPNFSIGDPITSEQVNAGAQLRLPVAVTNSGARDAWNMTASTSPTRAWAFTFYVDNAPLGTYGAEDIALVDTDADGTGDTGLVETDAVRKMWAVADIPAGDASGAIVVDLKASSSAYPDVAESVQDTVTVVGQACVGCTLVPYYLKNASGPIGNSNLKASMLLETSMPGAYSGVPNYDQNENADPGRTLVKGGTSLTESDNKKIALWETMVSGSLRLNGTATVNLVVEPKSLATDKTTTLRVFLARKVGSTVTVIASGETTFKFDAPKGFQVVPGPDNPPLSLTIPDITLPNNSRLQLYVVSPDSNDDVFLAYGTELYSSNIVLPKI
jgi:prepilin-type N-terminal cleavage/methylation domain-containing protein